jgi:hypothetical protein
MKHKGTTYNAKQMVNSMIQGYLEKETIIAPQVDDAHARLGKYDSPHACILSILRHNNYDASLHSHIAMMNFGEALGLGSFECP